MEKRVFKSAIGLWLWLIIWLVIVGTMIITLRPVVHEPNEMPVWLFVVIWLPIIAFILFIMLGISYEIVEGLLIVKMGPFTERQVEIGQIKSLERSNSIMSSPANSLRCLRILYKGGEVLISPKQEADFVGLLKEINPDIVVKDLNND